MFFLMALLYKEGVRIARRQSVLVTPLHLCFVVVHFLHVMRCV